MTPGPLASEEHPQKSEGPVTSRPFVLQHNEEHTVSEELDERNTDLTDRFEKHYAPGWRPAIHEIAQGVVAELGERLGYDDKPYPIVVIRKGSGEEVALHAFHYVLRSKLAEEKPAIGDRIAVRYDGKVKSKTGGKAYHSYSVVRERANAEVASPADPRDDDIPFRAV
jgi:hypothetical protein